MGHAEVKIVVFFNSFSLEYSVLLMCFDDNLVFSLKYNLLISTTVKIAIVGELCYSGFIKSREKGNKLMNLIVLHSRQ